MADERDGPWTDGDVNGGLGGQPPDEASAAPARPIDVGERITSIDTLRGVAVLGILPMNLPFFALSDHAWMNPTIAGPLVGIDRVVWLAGHLIFEMKMMSIFSMLFGAGLASMAVRAAARGGDLAGVYYRRILWLLVIGLIHAYLLWWGDILVAYALCGLVLFPLRRLRAKALVALGLAMVVIAIPMGVGHAFSMVEQRKAAAEAQAVIDLGGPPAAEQTEAIEEWKKSREDFEPTPDMLAEERTLYEESGLPLLRRHAEESFFWHTKGMVFWAFWRVGGLMVLGMGLFRMGVFSAALPARVYRAMCAIGYCVGLPLVALGAVRNMERGFDFIDMFMIGSHFNYVGSMFVAAGHIGLVMMVCRSGALARTTARLAAVGRMALTNYLAQTVICLTLFRGWGFGLWGDMSRAELLLVMAGVWTLELLWSPWWLARFRFGPMEWVWRSLTYWKPQPMRLSALRAD